MMRTAYIWADESYCERKKVGAVLAKKGRILACGYNGTVVGTDNKCEEKNSNNEIISKKDVVHAEANALSFAGRYGIKTNGCTMYITLSPCIECAKLMIQHGIKKVYYSEDYRDLSGVLFLKEHGVKIKKI